MVLEKVRGMLGSDACLPIIYVDTLDDVDVLRGFEPGSSLES